MGMFRLFLLALPLLALTGCRVRHDWHQKLTLVVQTPAGEVSGSAVVGVTALFGNIPMTGTEVEYSVQGEATVVEVAPGRYLFALVRGSEERFYYAARDRFSGMQRGKWLGKIARQTEAVSLLPDNVPMLVTYADITDPASVLQIDPDDLDAVFGCNREPAGLVMPWRAAGLPFRVWLPDEALRRANAEASARAGITGEAAAALEETFHIRRPNWGPTTEESARLEVLARAFTREQKIAWEQARDAFHKELPALIPTPAATAAAWGGQCHQLTGVTLEVTEEPVTEGVVAGIVGVLP